MIKILKNVFFAFLVDILRYSSIFANKQSFDLKIFVVDFFIIFLVFIIYDFSDYIESKNNDEKNKEPVETQQD